MRQIRLLALPLASLVLVGCQVVGVPTSATEICAASARDYAGTLVGSFTTTVGANRRLEGLVEPARWPGIGPDRPAVLCFIDAETAKGPPPGPNGEIRDPFDRVVIGIVDEEDEMVTAGYRDQLPVQAP